MIRSYEGITPQFPETSYIDDSAHLIGDVIVGVDPDAGVLADNDVADEVGGVVDVGGFGELGSDAFVGADHGFEQQALSCEPSTYHGGIAEVRWQMGGKGLNHSPHAAVRHPENVKMRIFAPSESSSL